MASKSLKDYYFYWNQPIFHSNLLISFPGNQCLIQIGSCSRRWAKGSKRQVKQKCLKCAIFLCSQNYCVPKIHAVAGALRQYVRPTVVSHYFLSYECNAGECIFEYRPIYMFRRLYVQCIPHNDHSKRMGFFVIVANVNASYT